jgi:hypothetical protein
MTDLLLGMCEPVRVYVSRAVTRPARLVEVRKKRERNEGMPTNCARNIETSTTKPISKRGYDKEVYTSMLSHSMTNGLAAKPSAALSMVNT